MLWLLFLTVILSKSCWATTKLQEQFSWAVLDYAYPDSQSRAQAIATKRFIPENNLPVGLEIWKDKMFITVPRWRPGIPSTLNYYSPLASNLNRSPPLSPYPDWASNELGNCETGLSTVYRIKADRCDRLWVLDTGTFGIGNTTQNPCPHALNIFDLNTDIRLRRYVLRPEDTTKDTFIANIVVDLDEEDACEDAFAYLSDELAYGLIVYSFRENKSWRFEHSFFMPDPLAGNFRINGLNFQWGKEGIFGMALSPRQRNGDRILYFSPLASFREFAVSTRTLRNSTGIQDSYYDFYALDERGYETHTTARVMTRGGVEFFSLIDRNSIGCWNYANPYRPENIGIVDEDDDELIFPSDVKLDQVERNLWVMSDRMSDFLESDEGLDFSEINFRVMFAPVDVLVKGTVCERFIPLKPERYYRYESVDNFKFNSHHFY